MLGEKEIKIAAERMSAVNKEQGGTPDTCMEAMGLNWEELHSFSKDIGYSRMDRFFDLADQINDRIEAGHATEAQAVNAMREYGAAQFVALFSWAIGIGMQLERMSKENG